jgi:hypothetical protein
MEKLNNSQIIELIELSNEIGTNKPFLREGQCLFNTLYQLYPELADSLRGTEFDPFYNDKIIDKFLKYISKK